MEEDRPNIDLTLATPEDMVAELERRGCAAVLVLSHTPRGKEYQYQPNQPISDVSDLPPKDIQRVVSDSRYSKNPALKAALLCDGIQICLTELADIMPKKRAWAIALDCANLSKLVEVAKAGFRAAFFLTNFPDAEE